MHDHDKRPEMASQIHWKRITVWSRFFCLTLKISDFRLALISSPTQPETCKFRFRIIGALYVLGSSFMYSNEI